MAWDLQMDLDLYMSNLMHNRSTMVRSGKLMQVYDFVKSGKALMMQKLELEMYR